MGCTHAKFKSQRGLSSQVCDRCVVDDLFLGKVWIYLIFNSFRPYGRSIVFYQYPIDCVLFRPRSNRSALLGCTEKK